MSVVIENMEMPKDCVHCRFNNASGQRTTLCDLVGCGWIKIKENHRADECPLAETQPESKWIPCSDKIPSESQECWITAKDGTVCQGMFTRQYGERRDSGFICNNGFAWLNTVVAWMPYDMPEPWEGETDGSD